MKKLIILFTIMALSATFGFAQEQDQKKFDVNFKNISMKEFITFVAAFTENNIVYSEGDLRGTVTLSSNAPITGKEVMEIFYATLASNGLTAVKEGSYIRVLPDKDMPNYNDKFRPNAKNLSDDSFITTILILDSYNSNALANTLTRVKSKNGNVEALRGINGLLIKDTGSRIEKMRSIAKAMDSYAADYQLYSLTIGNTTASKMEQQINKLFSELMKNSLVGNMPMLVSDDISNVIVVAADTESFKKIQYLVSQIDIKNMEANTLPRVFYLKYAKAEDLEAVLNKLLIGGQAPIAGTKAPTIKSSVSSDKGTNSIIAIGDQELYSNLENMIEKLDIPRKQVYVEALILETSLDRNDSFGVEWFAGGADKSKLVGFGGSQNVGELNPLLTAISAGTAPPLSSLPGGFSGGLIGDTVTFNGIKFPTLGAFLTALRSNAGVNIVSNPQILTLDNEEAEVFIGENRPYVTSEKFDSNNNPIQTFDYRDVGIRLKVVPHITGDNAVNLEIEQEVNKISPAATGFKADAPVTLTRTTKTKVQLYDRSIMLISGLMKDDSSVVEKGIPILSSIPILGWLFKSNSVSYEKTNLMVFITAHIINTEDDMDMIVERRTRGTSEFDSRVNEMISKRLSEDKLSFIPMQNEVKEFLDIKTIQSSETKPYEFQNYDNLESDYTPSSKVKLFKVENNAPTVFGFKTKGGN